MNNWLRIVQQGLYPPTCLLCGLDAGMELDLCARCAADLPWRAVACPTCGGALDVAPDGLPCGQCLRHPPPFDRLHAPFWYAGGIRHLISALKFHARYPAARVLGEMMAGYFAGLDARPEMLIPVPLHPQRYAERGFNQALELARPIARRLGVPLDWSICVRVRATPHQTGQDARARRANLKDAFAVPGAIRARHVAIVDDVVTTGATVSELARALRRAGVVRVDVWSAARTLDGAV